MASIIMMRNPDTGIIRKGFYGFSWTTLFFGGFPALFRGDILTGLIVIALNILTSGLAGIVWAFFYNKYYTQNLVREGFQFMGDSMAIEEAMLKLDIANPPRNSQ